MTPEQRIDHLIGTLEDEVRTVRSLHVVEPDEEAEFSVPIMPAEVQMLRDWFDSVRTEPPLSEREPAE